MFDAEGRFLGPVEVPEEWGAPTFGNTFARDNVVIKVVQDESGTILVKRYRLAIPGEDDARD